MLLPTGDDADKSSIERRKRYLSGETDNFGRWRDPRRGIGVEGEDGWDKEPEGVVVIAREAMEIICFYMPPCKEHAFCQSCESFPKSSKQL